MTSPRFLLSLRSFLSALTLAAALTACSSSAPAPEGPTTPPPANPPAGDPSTTPTTPPAPEAGAECIRTGCSGTVCTEAGKEVMTTCEMRPEYECYASAKCEKQSNGACGFTQTPELTSCVAAARAK
jgi:eight-cysteine-cluster-containing protein